MPKRKRYNLSVDSIHDSKIGIKYHLDDKLVDLLNNLDRRINWFKTLVNSTYGLPAKNKIEPLEKIVGDEDKDKIELLEKLQGETNAKKSTFKNYSGFDLLNDLTKPCKKCGCKPTIGNMYGYKEKYQLACMNCTCTNMEVVSGDNFYKVIDKWNEIQGEIHESS